MMTSKIRACFDNDVDFLVRAIEASGDCFYECVSIALQEGKEKEEDRGDGENNTTVLQLRKIVADSLDASKLDELRMLASSGLEDYSFVFEIWDHDCCGAKRKRKRRKKEKMMEKSEFATLRVVKDRLMRSGKTTGPQGCVWADEWAMQVLSANLGITLLFVNEEVRCGNGRFVMIAPSDRLGVSGRGETKKKKKKKRVYSSGEQTTAILLQRTRRQHINIISYRKQFLVDVNVLPSHVTRKWSALGRCLSATGTTSTPNTEDDNRKETETSLPLDDFSTRIASSKDLESLVSLINTAYESEKVKLPHIKRTNEEEISKILHESNDREFLLVALKRDTLELAGCVLVRDVSKDTAYFGMLSVHPAFRRRGLGGHLQRKAERWARHSGHKSRIVCFVINVNDSLIARYRAQGFLPTGHSKNWDPSFVKYLLPEYRESYFVEYGKSLGNEVAEKAPRGVTSCTKGS